MSEGSLAERLDGVLDRLRTTGWIAQQVELTEADNDDLRMEVFNTMSIWIAKDGLKAYRNVPVATTGASQIVGFRDGETRVYPLPRRARQKAQNSLQNRLRTT